MKKQIVISLILISLFISTAHGMNSCTKYIAHEMDLRKEDMQWNKEKFPDFCCNRKHPLIEAIQNNSSKEVKRQLKNNADPNKRNCGGCTPLSFVFNKSISILRILLKHKADPNAYRYPRKESMDNWRELDGAIAFGKEKHVTLLLQSGADPFGIREEHKKKFWQNTQQKNKNIELVQAAQKKRFTPLLLYIKTMYPDFPKEMYEEISWALQKYLFTFSSVSDNF